MESVKRTSKGKMEEKNKREKGAKAPNRTTVEDCEEESYANPPKRRRGERLQALEIDEKIDEPVRITAAELKAGISMLPALVNKLNELEKVVLSNAKSGGTTEKGMSNCSWWVTSDGGEELWNQGRSGDGRLEKLRQMFLTHFRTLGYVTNRVQWALWRRPGGERKKRKKGSRKGRQGGMYGSEHVAHCG